MSDTKYATTLRQKAVLAEVDGKKTFGVEPGKLLDLLTAHDAAIAAKDAEIARLKDGNFLFDDIVRLTNQVGTLQRELEASKADLTACSKQFDEVSTIGLNLEGRSIEQAETIAALERKVAEQASKIDNLENLLERKTVTIDILRDANKANSEAYFRMRGDRDDEIAALKGDVAALLEALGAIETGDQSLGGKFGTVKDLRFIARHAIQAHTERTAAREQGKP